MMPPSVAVQKNELRDDIQGVRAIGSVLVFLFHVFFNGVSGGVDVFFVVSGYFMARNAARRSGIGAPVDVLGSYKNFLLRIAPQAVIALVGITLIVFFFSSPMGWAANLRDIAASALYIENWWLIDRGQDYLARSEALSFTQHFWAISLIGQSYFAWPLIMCLSNALARISKRDPGKTLACLLFSLSLMSFCWSVYATATMPSIAYFDFFARFWEFGTGALLGLFSLHDREIGKRTAALLSWIGTSLLLSCGFLIGSRLAFPGYASIWPVAAALLIIRFGRPADRINASWFFARPLFVRLGGISFGIYLWHWPLYALYEESAYRSYGNHLAAGVAIFAVSAVLAVLTKAAAEKAVQAFRAPARSTLVPLGVLGILVAISVTTETTRRYIMKNGVRWDKIQMAQAGFITPGPFRIRGDNAEVYKSGCHQSARGEVVKTCSFGAGAAGKKIVLVGGSHSAQWLPALTVQAAAENWNVVSMTKSGCLFADPADRALFEGLDPSCKSWNIEAMARIIALEPDLVLSIATRAKDVDAHRIEYLPEGYRAWFARLNTAGIKVLAIRDNPWMQKDMPRCVYSPVVTNKLVCGDRRASVLDDDGFRSVAGQMPANVRIADLTGQFCDQRDCWAVKDGVSIYRDSHHITATYAKRISASLRDEINAVWLAPRALSEASANVGAGRAPLPR